jgi:circadian clock protein KaiC
MGAGRPAHRGVEKLETGIAGFDYVTMGGLPRRRTAVIAGPAGSAKTVFLSQFLAEGVRRGEPGVYVTLEEPAEDLRTNLITLGIDVSPYEERGEWAFVDASPLLTPDGSQLAPYHVDTLMSQIGHAVDRTGAVRLGVDSINSMLSLVPDEGLARQQLRYLAAGLRRMGLTSVLTLESSPDRDLGIEEYVADTVILLRNIRERKIRRRTVEVLKMRGAPHRKGDYPFTVLPGRGIVVLPLSAAGLLQQSSASRVSSGNTELDALCEGGFFRDSVVLVSGATGTGKTLLATEFIAGGAALGERSLYFAFEEGRDQIARNAAGWGYDFAKLEADNLLRIVPLYPEMSSLEDHLVEIKTAIDSYRPTRVAIDSLSALERVGSTEGYREFALGLTAFVKEQRITTLFTAATPALFGGTSITEGHISTLTDSIILLRYVEIQGTVNRGITVLKMRGSRHDNQIRRFHIDSSGMRIGEPYRRVGGILSGNVVNLLTEQLTGVDTVLAEE